MMTIEFKDIIDDGIKKLLHSLGIESPDGGYAHDMIKTELEVMFKIGRVSVHQPDLFNYDDYFKDQERERDGG